MRLPTAMLAIAASGALGCVGSVAGPERDAFGPEDATTPLPMGDASSSDGSTRLSDGGGLDGTALPSDSGQNAVSDECDTTDECRAIWGSTATDCRDSQSDRSVCVCGTEPCINRFGRPDAGVGDADFVADGGRTDAGVAAEGCQVSGELRVWHRVAVTCQGPMGIESSPATFSDNRMVVRFSKVGSGTFDVLGHFAANGRAALSGADRGRTWRAYFMPPSTGTWQYSISFRSGREVAVSLDPNEGRPVPGIDGRTGGFAISPSNKSGRDLRGRGLLEHRRGERYLRFAGDGRAFVEGGVDSPENLFGYSEFDNTRKHSNVGSCKGILHDFRPHRGDFNASSDPTWAGGRGDELIGLINYLSSTGVNALYLVPMSVNGDGCDAHPWTDYFGNRRSFDVSKLDQWEIAFSHMTKMGLLIHFVTQETENDQLLNGGRLGLERKLYYREMISRFAHHPALQWNLGEENTNTDTEVRAFADTFKGWDPYDHPVVMHTYPGQRDRYEELLGLRSFDGPTLQFGGIPESGSGGLYGEVARWLERSRAAGHPWYVTATEASGGDAPTPNAPVNRRRRVFWMWASVMGGGAGFEWYLKNAGNGHAYDLSVENLREFDAHWIQSGYLVRFFDEIVQGNGVDLQSLTPANGLTSTGSDWVLANPGTAYIVYLRDGGSTEIQLTGGGSYQVKWFNPRTGRLTAAASLPGQGTPVLGAPPSSGTEDWAVLLHR